MHNLYNLYETCSRVDVSAPWVKKVMSIYNLKDLVEQHGGRVFYTLTALDALREIKGLRTIGLTFDEISEYFTHDHEEHYKELIKSKATKTRTIAEEILNAHTTK